MELQQLKYFVALAQCLNLSTVAKQNYITQPAISHQITKLEESLNIKLFNRTTHGVLLTEAGDVFYRYATQMLDLVNQAEQQMESISQGKQGTLRIFAVPSVLRITSTMLRAFHRRYPDISLNLVVGTGAQQITEINRRSFDIYLSFASLLTDSAELETAPCPPDRFAVFVSREYEKRVDAQNLFTLRGMPCLTESLVDAPFLFGCAEKIFAERGYAPEEVLYFNSPDSVMLAVDAGLGYALYPMLIQGACPETVARLPVPGEAAVVRNALGWHRGTTNTAVKKFLTVFSELDPEALTR